MHFAAQASGLIRPLSNWDSLFSSPEASQNSAVNQVFANRAVKAMAEPQVPYYGQAAFFSNITFSICAIGSAQQLVSIRIVHYAFCLM